MPFYSIVVIVSGGYFMQSNLYIKRDVDKKEGIISLENLDSFWTLSSSSTYEVSCRGNVRKYATLESLEKDFISLEKFLSKATKLGYEFQRTAGIVDDDNEIDNRYTGDSGYNEYIALYTYAGIVLAYQINPYFDYNFSEDAAYHCYTIIPKFYTKDGNYTLTGKPGLLDKRDIYYDIISQERKNEKKLALKKGKKIN